MGCRLIQSTLVAYYFGAADAAERDATDAHLVSCPACLRAYLEIKRHAEAADDDAPSDALRTRLRADLARVVTPPLAARVRQWASRPIPRYHLASAAALVLLVATLLARQSTEAPAPTVSARIDSSRTASNPASVY